jgi:hypothetical protein
MQKTAADFELPNESWVPSNRGSESATRPIDKIGSCKEMDELQIQTEQDTSYLHIASLDSGKEGGG